MVLYYILKGGEHGYAIRVSIFCVSRLFAGCDDFMSAIKVNIPPAIFRNHKNLSEKILKISYNLKIIIFIILMK